MISRRAFFRYHIKYNVAQLLDRFVDNHSLFLQMCLHHIEGTIVLSDSIYLAYNMAAIAEHFIALFAAYQAIMKCLKHFHRELIVTNSQTLR